MNDISIQDIIAGTLFELNDEIASKELKRAIMENFPGNYTIEIDRVDQDYLINLKFTDPEEATLFRLKGLI